MFGHAAISRMPEYFDNPEDFRPERWLRTGADTIHPFAVMPFGNGPRMCVGRRIAEQQMYLILVKVYSLMFEIIYYINYIENVSIIISTGLNVILPPDMG